MVKGGGRKKIIVYCGFEIFISSESSSTNKDIPCDFQVGSLYKVSGQSCLFVQCQVSTT